MVLAQIHSRACTGVDAPQVTVELHPSGGLPKFQIVGAIWPKSKTGISKYSLSPKFRLESLLRGKCGVKFGYSQQTKPATEPAQASQH